MMKKAIYKLLSIIICISSFLLNAIPVQAASQLTFTNPYGVAPGKWSVNFTQTGDWGGTDDYYAVMTLNGQKVYCVEPLVNVIYGAEYDYSVNDLPSFTGSQYTANQIEYISALGYGFGGDYSGEMDYATQIRIWQEVMPGIVNTATIHPDIQAKIDEINSRLFVMNQEVSFNHQNVVLNGYGKENAITLTDESGCFQYYNDYYTLGIHTQRDGNNLTIWAEPGDENNVDLAYDCLYFRNQVGTSIVYNSSYSQTVAYLQGVDPKALVLNVKVASGEITIEKQDEETKRAQGDATLQGAEFSVLDTTTNEVVATLVSDENGKCQTVDNLSTSHIYTIEETKAPKGYLKSEEKKTVDFSTFGSNIYSEPFTDRVITGRIQIEKIIANDEETYCPEPEEGAEFAVVLKQYVNQYGSVDEALKHVDEISDKEYDLMKTDKKGIATSKELAYGVYVIQQTKSSDKAYILKEPFEAKIESDKQTLNYTVKNKPILFKVKLVKKDAITKENISLSSAFFKIKDEKGEYVTMSIGNKTYDTFATTSDNGIGFITSLKGNTYYDENGQKGCVVTPLTLGAGKYTIEEVQTPTGFITSNPIPFEISKEVISLENQEPCIEIVIEDEQPTGSLKIEKKIDEIVGDTHLEQIDLTGIEFSLIAKENIESSIDGSILYKKNEIVNTYKTDEKGCIEVKEIPLGKYVLKETKTKDGLVLDSNEYDVIFNKEDEKTKEYVVSYTISNQPTITEFSKTDVTGQEELEGATLTVYDDQMNEIDKWVSTKNKHVITGLSIGKKYTLEESISKDGYVKASSIEFTVLNDKEVQKVHMIDKIVDVSKEDLGGQEVEGASIVVFDENGQEIDSWTSGKEVHRICNLEEGKTYTLHEDAAPAGYEIANDIEFTVDFEKEDMHLTMIDKKLDTISITKYDATSKKELPGAKLKLTDKDGNVIDEWISTEDEHIIKDLYVNEEYTLTEVQVPDQYCKAESITFKIEDNGKVVQKVKMYDERKSVVHTRVITHRFLFSLICSLSFIAGIYSVVQMKKKND